SRTALPAPKVILLEGSAGTRLAQTQKRSGRAKCVRSALRFSYFSLRAQDTLPRFYRIVDDQALRLRVNSPNGDLHEAAGATDAAASPTLGTSENPWLHD